ncbi:hypothetical protein NQ317_019427 [Molorchus minor]|uniref:Integrase catalytic domain-containing protein n=1 Tax=Molorchus minor TaxID=1323400 RepID=A0ABQ9IUU0_9CUCU|nr:hypothetical protein NQ317_019427 [Molorchus minor]
MNNTNAKSVISCLRTVFSRFGLPDTLVSDNGPPFSSTEFSNYIKKNGIKHLFSPPYHAQSNGFAENSVKNIKKAIKKAFIEKTDIEESVNRFLFDYRIAQHSTTGVSPAILMFGRNLKTRFDLIRPSQSQINENNIQRQIDNFNGKQKDMQLGDSVFVKDFSSTSSSNWLPGKIINQAGNVVFDVNLGGNRVVRRHSKQIKKRESSTYPLSTEITEIKNNVTKNTDVSNSNETFSSENSASNNLDKTIISETTKTNADTQKNDNHTGDNISASDIGQQESQCGSSRYFLRSRIDK